MKQAEKIVLLLVTLSILGGGYAIYWQVEERREAVQEAVADGAFERPITSAADEPQTEEWESIYPNTVPMLIADVPVRASVADSLPERIKGLSGTPYLPDQVVKLFAFGVPGEHAIWMKDMNYALDILWVAEAGEIVHIEEAVSPDSFPQSFSSPRPAWFVVEANAGFVASNTIAVGDSISIPATVQ